MVSEGRALDTRETNGIALVIPGWHMQLVCHRSPDLGIVARSQFRIFVAVWYCRVHMIGSMHLASTEASMHHPCPWTRTNTGTDTKNELQLAFIKGR